MGEPVTTALLIGATVVQVGMQHVAAKKQERAGEIQQNAQVGEDRTTRQEAARANRIRRARILQAGENTGTGGSSQESGAIGGMETIFAQAQGNQKGQQLNNIAIGNQMQGAADAQSAANTFAAISSLTMQYAAMNKPPSTTTNVVDTADLTT